MLVTKIHHVAPSGEEICIWDRFHTLQNKIVSYVGIMVFGTPFLRLLQRAIPVL